MKGIYLDHASATPVDPRVIEFAHRYLRGNLANPSALHSAGQEAKRALEEARAKVAELINAEEESCIVFTSGATESNNLAIKGAALRNAGKGKGVTASAIEHISVFNSMKELKKSGFEMKIIPVDSTGVIRLNELADILSPDTTVTSVMYANNEIGTIEPISEVSRIVHQKGLYLHVDGTAAAGKIPVDVQRDRIDLLTLSSNDLGGPQGCGALYVKPGVKIQTVIPGGGQERGLRSGTEQLFAIAGMGAAAKIAKNEMDEEGERLRQMRDELIAQITQIDGVKLTGHPERRLPHHTSFIFSELEGESILMNLDTQYNIQVASGSPCSALSLLPSHVLRSMGFDDLIAHGSVLMTLGRINRSEEVPRIICAVRETVEKLKKISG